MLSALELSRGSVMSDSVRFIVNWEALIMDEIANRHIRRRSVAQTYRYLIERNDPATDWRTINAAIIKRWSKSGLMWIKTQAWNGKCLPEYGAALAQHHGTEGEKQ